MPVDVWAGTDDQLLDPKWPHELTRRIPDATLHLMPGGYFLAHLHYREIFDGSMPVSSRARPSVLRRRQ